MSSFELADDSNTEISYLPIRSEFSPELEHCYPEGHLLRNVVYWDTVAHAYYNRSCDLYLLNNDSLVTSNLNRLNRCLLR